VCVGAASRARRRAAARSCPRLVDGRIVRFWGEQDLFGLLRGLGMLPDGPIEF
jgi:hypothetical protein